MSSLWSYCFPFQLYLSIILFKAKYHQPQERPSLISLGSCGMHPSVQYKYTHTPAPSSYDSTQWWAVCESPSVRQVWQFTQSLVTLLIYLVQRKHFFFPDSPHSFRGMRENLSALLWHSACCLCAIRPAAFLDRHCIVSVVLLVPRQNL